MTPTRVAALIGAALTIGCWPLAVTVDPVAEAKARDMARRGSIAVRMTMASGALTASLCDVGQAAWSELAGDELDISPEIAALMGVTGGGAVFYDQSTGEVTVEWFDAELDEGIPGSITLSVLRPTSEYKVVFIPTDDYLDPEQNPEPVLDVAEAVISFTDVVDEDDVLVVDACNSAEGVPKIAFAIQNVEDGLAIVNVPAEEGEQGVWIRGDAWPVEGTYFWDRGEGVERERLLGEDAVNIVDGVWPSTAEQGDWTDSVDVPLARGTY